MQKDEIKEILDNLKGILDEPKGLDETPNGNLYEYDRSYDLEQDEIKILLDYITNLQDRIKELEQINEEHCKINGELRKTINEAVDYIKKHGLYDEEIGRCADELNDDEVTDVLWLLQGSDK